MKLALGAAQFGQIYGVANKTGELSVRGVSTILDYCKSEDIKIIDTAVGYGESEKYLGIANVADFDVITKLPAIPESCSNAREWVESQINDSLNRLNLKSLYGVMLHRPEQLFGYYGPSLLRALINLKKSGKVQKIGVSIYDPEELTGIFRLYVFDIVQAPFNPIDRRLVSSGWLQNLSTQGVEIHCRSCFLQGLLLMPRAEIPRKFEVWSSIWDEWHHWLEFNSISAIEACLSFIGSYEKISHAVVGVDNLDHLKEIVSAYIRPIKVDIFPELSGSDDVLINPSKWHSL